MVPYYFGTRHNDHLVIVFESCLSRGYVPERVTIAFGFLFNFKERTERENEESIKLEYHTTALGASR